MVCQLNQIIIVAGSLALVIMGYIVVQDQLHTCMLKLGGIPVLNLVAAITFGFHPIVLTKLVTMHMYCSAAFHGVVAWEDSNPSEGFGFSMLFGQAVGRLYEAFFDTALLLLMTLWIVTGGVVFSLVFLPISVCVGLSWLVLQGILYLLLRAASYVEQQANLTAKQNKSDAQPKVDEKVESDFRADCKMADVVYLDEEHIERRVGDNEKPRADMVILARMARDQRHAEMRKRIQESIDSDELLQKRCFMNEVPYVQPGEVDELSFFQQWTRMRVEPSSRNPLAAKLPDMLNGADSVLKRLLVKKWEAHDEKEKRSKTDPANDSHRSFLRSLLRHICCCNLFSSLRHCLVRNRRGHMDENIVSLDDDEFKAFVTQLIRERVIDDRSLLRWDSFVNVKIEKEDGKGIEEFWYRPARTSLSAQQEAKRKRRHQRMWQAILRKTNARITTLRFMPKSMVPALSAAAGSIKNALWWLDDNERPRGRQLSVAFGIGYLASIWNRYRLILNYLVCPCTPVSEERKASALAVKKLLKADESRSSIMSSQSSFPAHEPPPSPPASPPNTKFRAAVNAARLGTRARNSTSTMEMDSSQPVTTSTKMRVQHVINLTSKQLGSTKERSKSDATGIKPGRSRREREAEKEEQEDSGANLAFSKDDEGCIVAIQHGSVRLLATGGSRNHVVGTAASRCSRLLRGVQPGFMRDRWNVRLAIWPEAMLKQHERWRQRLDGIILTVADDKVTGVVHSDEISWRQWLSGKLHGNIQSPLQSWLDILRSSKDLTPVSKVPASGLEWKRVGSNKLTGAVELRNETLAKALGTQTQFSPVEWKGFGIENLRLNHFVKTSDGSVQPALPDSHVLSTQSDGSNEALRELLQKHELVTSTALAGKIDDARLRELLSRCIEAERHPKWDENRIRDLLLKLQKADIVTWQASFLPPKQAEFRHQSPKAYPRVGYHELTELKNLELKKKLREKWNISAGLAFLQMLDDEESDRFTKNATVIQNHVQRWLVHKTLTSGAAPVSREDSRRVATIRFALEEFDLLRVGSDPPESFGETSCVTLDVNLGLLAPIRLSKAIIAVQAALRDQLARRLVKQRRADAGSGVGDGADEESAAVDGAKKDLGKQRNAKPRSPEVTSSTNSMKVYFTPCLPEEVTKLLMTDFQMNEKQVEAFRREMWFKRPRMETFEFDNPERTSHAAFSKLFYDTALPVLIVAPAILYGSLCALLCYYRIIQWQVVGEIASGERDLASRGRTSA